ncbi:SgcJ/EcaC family oxidoreductase [Micromonospora sp. NPDC049051]|uniref:SgcJ/EcaC family oxidoreductase n=1 Tax=unclassified Micromonospora TaxID=2617518 RepID=UPI003714784C
MTVSTATSAPGVANDKAALDAYYGEFTGEKEKEALSVPLRLVAAWARNDADGVADVFTEDGILILPGDVYKKSREEIRAFMAAAYAGPFKNSGVTGRPVDVRFIGDDIALLRTHGGILAEGETEISPELAVRSTWVVVKRDGEWKLAAYQNSPRGAGATLRW